ncbi:serine/threonine protein kinase [Mycobacterium sp. M1]|uniref:non-specific serine/threonine protein kinase n=1 Tax=Mycolicibacter acidiphilus TaxID=2835306 RepID=A0ABS5RER9_9MYCO|nr:serine/threonine-protein kinase [Mycolicibacter acidiphilus]MBS9532772.1 serine/threonine protein kinase [Mycolicibacter acidiphilus]
MSDTAQGSRVGSQFGHYQLKRLLGRGGMGEVYEADDLVKDRTVALKLLSPALSQDPVFRERLQREARTAGRLQEPHVVPVHDFGELEGQLFLDMRLIQGLDLAAILREAGVLPPRRAVNIISQAASALDAAHAAGVIHRDIKPENILVARDDFAYLCDFGIASANTDDRLTQMGNAVGTWKYSAPERFTGDEVDSSIDVYALACVLYECLTGSPPYRADNPGALITAQLMEPVPMPSRLAPEIPAGFDDVIACGMAKDPKERYASAGDLARAAYRALSSSPARMSAAAGGQNPAPQVSTPTPPPGMVLTPPPGSVPTPPPSNPSPTPLPTPPPSGPSHTTPPGMVLTPPPGPTPTPLPGPTPTPLPGPTPTPPPGPTHTPPPGMVLTPPPGLASTPSPGPHFGTSTWPGPGRPPRGPSRHAHPLPDSGAKRRNALIAVAAVLILLTVVLIVRSHRGHGDEIAEPSAPMGSAEMQDRLSGLLPAGYAKEACTAAPLEGKAVAKLSCRRNTDPGGPASATFTLFPDVDGLRAGFEEATGLTSLVNCPGGVQSPGPWHRAATPQQASGMLMCGSQQGSPTLAWSNYAQLFLSVVHGGEGGPTLEQLSAWWSSHS